MPSFWLSHHREEEWNRTYAFGGTRVCARCLGVYPVLLAAMAVQVALHTPLAWRFDGVWSLGLLAPALLDWGYGRFRPRTGTNLWRTFTGVLLGLALGRTLYVHMLRPFPFWLLVQAGLVTALALPVILATYKRRGPP